METAFLALVVAQGLMGGLDTLVNHDLIERLGQRASARMEVGLHALRESIYGLLFAGLAWYTWHGSAVAIVAGLLIAEFMVSSTDEYVENCTRVLPNNERVLHAFLTLNLGLIMGVGALVLMDRASDPTGIALRDPDPFTWALSALSLASLFWAARDFSAWRILLHRPILARRRS